MDHLKNEFDYRVLTQPLAEQYADDMIALSRDVEWDTWTRENLLQDREGKWDLSVIAFDGETVVGYVMASKRGDICHLHHLVVSSSTRGRGLGRQLMRQSALRAKEMGYRNMSLKVYETNPALRLWELIGWERTGRQDDLILMNVVPDVMIEKTK